MSGAVGPRAVFRADAGRAIGGGHVMRCLALARALKDEGWQLSFAGTPETFATVGALAKSGIDWHPLERPAAPQSLMDAASDCDLLVVDHYGLDVGYEAACRGWAKAILAIDDLADRRHDCDFLLDQTLGRKSADYEALVPLGCRLLAGPDYALLHPDFAALRGQRERGEAVDRVLISFGMMDAPGFLLQAIPVAREMLPRATIDVLVGSGAPHLARLRELAAEARIDLHLDSGRMAELMHMADLAIVGAGTTVWEACCMAVPAILLVAAQNQRGIAASMRRANACKVIDAIPELESALRQMLDSSAQRRETAARLGAICDGRGSRRVAAAIRPELARGEPVHLRRLTEADAQLLLDWQRHPTTRRFARNPAIPSEAEHMAWFAAKLRDPGCLLSMITEDGIAAGMVRLDRRKDEAASAYEVSILVAPDRYGRGLGAAALRAARRLAPEARLYAEVHAENVASHALFTAAGYVRQNGCYVSLPHEGIGL